RPIDEARKADRNARQGMRLATGLEQRHLIAATLAEAAGERGPGRAGADHNEINRKLIHALVVPLPNWTRAAPVRRLAQEARSRPPPSADGCPLARSAPQRVPARPAWVPASAIGAMAAWRPRRMACHCCRSRHS